MRAGSLGAATAGSTNVNAEWEPCGVPFAFTAEIVVHKRTLSKDDDPAQRLGTEQVDPDL
jgi:hypothetical protein